MKRKTVNQLIGIVLVTIQFVVFMPIVASGFLWGMIKFMFEIGINTSEDLTDFTSDKLYGK